MKVHLQDADGISGRQRVAGTTNRPAAERATHLKPAGRLGTALADEPTTAAPQPFGIRPRAGYLARTRPPVAGAAAIYSAVDDAIEVEVEGERSRGSRTTIGDGRATADATARLISHPPEGLASHPPEKQPGGHQRQSLRCLRSDSATPRNDAVYYRVCCQLKRHLRDPRKPLIVVVGESPDSELFQQVVAAYGASSPLRAAADLVLAVTGSANVTGSAHADGPANLNRSPSVEFALDEAEDRRERVKPLLFAIDRHDLYGNAAVYYPQEPGEEVIELLRVARDRGGVMVVAERDSTAPRFGLEILSSDFGVPIVSADSDDLADYCGSILADPELRFGWWTPGRSRRDRMSARSNCSIAIAALTATA